MWCDCKTKIMWKISVLGVVISLILPSLIHGGSYEHINVSSIELAANSNQNFSRDFFSAVANEERGNVICSPLSAQLALGMIWLGAKGNTRDQLTASLGLVENADDNQEAFKALQNELLAENTNEATIRIANKIYVESGTTLISDFQTNTLNIFGVEPSKVDFKDPDTRLNINEWVKNVTKDKIKDLIPEGSFGDSTKLVLVNALYFKGFWKKAFDPKLTANRTFTYGNATNEIQVKIPFMFQEGDFNMAHFRDLDASLLEMPYKGDHLSLVIVKPNPRKTLDELERALQTRKLSDLLKQARQFHDLEVFLPKFTMELTLDLNEPLRQMGIRDMFGAEADLSGLAQITRSSFSNDTEANDGSSNDDSPPLFVSKVAQKTFIDVSEEGTEAAAATFAEIHVMSLPPRFDINRPFLFYLVYRNNPNISPIVLFSGRYVIPPSL